MNERLIISWLFMIIISQMVTISEFHIKQMQDSTSSVNSDTDDSQSSGASLFPNSVALIYFSKVSLLLRSNDLLKSHPC